MTIAVSADENCVIRVDDKRTRNKPQIESQADLDETFVLYDRDKGREFLQLSIESAVAKSFELPPDIQSMPLLLALLEPDELFGLFHIQEGL